MGFGCWVLLRGASEFTELTGGDSSSMLHTSLSDDLVLVVVSISHAKVTKAEERQHQDNRKDTQKKVKRQQKGENKVPGKGGKKVTDG